MYCKNCGSLVDEEAAFCSNCGKKQIFVEIIEENNGEESIKNNVNAENGNNTQIADTVKTVDKTKKDAKLIIFAIIGAVVIAFCAIRGCLFLKSNRGLMSAGEIEQRLNEAYIKVWGETYIDFEKVTEFRIEEVEAKTHDQTFSCIVRSSDGVTGHTMNGLIKNGRVIQIQSSLFISDTVFNQADEGVRAVAIASLAFPTILFEENVTDINDIGNFISNMEFLDDYKSRIVCDDIEYTMMGGTGNGVALYVYTVRYLPAFSEGYFEDDPASKYFDQYKETQDVSEQWDIYSFCKAVNGYWGHQKSNGGWEVLGFSDDMIDDFTYQGAYWLKGGAIGNIEEIAEDVVKITVYYQETVYGAPENDKPSEILSAEYYFDLSCINDEILGVLYDEKYDYIWLGSTKQEAFTYLGNRVGY